MNPTLNKARAFAYAAHIGQKYGEGHYITHLDHAVDVLYRFGFKDAIDTRLFEAAYLHDTLEDTKVAFDDIALVFTLQVAYLVDSVTDQPGANRKERHLKTYPRIRAGGIESIVVKLADRIANVETSVRGPNKSKLAMYKKEYRDFREALKMPASYHVESMWKHLDQLLGWPF